MNKTAERILLAVVLLGLFIPGAVRLADPLGPHHDHSDVTIDDSQPPAEMAYNAMAQTERRSHTLTMGTTIDGTWQPDAFVIKTDHTNHRERVDANAFNATLYKNNHVIWRLERFDHWERLDSSVRSYTYRTFNPEAVRDDSANVTQVRGNETTVVLRVNDNATVSNITEDTQAFTCYNWNNLTLHIDREEQVLRQAIVEGHTAENCGDGFWTMKIVYRFSNWDETTVNRPSSIPYTPEELIDDVMEWREHHPSAQTRASTTSSGQSEVML